MEVDPMRKTIALVTAGMLVLSLGPGSAAAQKKKKKKKPSVEQKVEGTVALPAPFQNDSGCFAGLHRRIAILGQENVNGDVGYHFDVDKATWGTNFVLEPTGGLGSVDLDIYFYTEFGTPEQVVTDPGGAGAQFNTRAPGGEADVVPAQFNKVIVCMYGGQGGAGANAPFTYTAGTKVKPS
jgi:hypothetical protein